MVAYCKHPVLCMLFDELTTASSKSNRVTFILRPLSICNKQGSLKNEEPFKVVLQQECPDNYDLSDRHCMYHSGRQSHLKIIDGPGKKLSQLKHEFYEKKSPQDKLKDSRAILAVLPRFRFSFILLRMPTPESLYTGRMEWNESIFKTGQYSQYPGGKPFAANPNI